MFNGTPARIMHRISALDLLTLDFYDSHCDGNEDFDMAYARIPFYLYSHICV